MVKTDLVVNFSFLKIIPFFIFFNLVQVIRLYRFHEIKLQRFET